MFTWKPILIALTLVSVTGCHRHTPAEISAHVSEKIESKTEDLIDDLDANEAQAARIRGLGKKLSAEVPAVVESGPALKEAFHSTWKSDKANAAPLHAQIDSTVATLSKALHTAADTLVELHETLDPNQRAEITSHID